MLRYLEKTSRVRRCTYCQDLTAAAGQTPAGATEATAMWRRLHMNLKTRNEQLMRQHWCQTSWKLSATSWPSHDSYECKRHLEGPYPGSQPASLQLDVIDSLRHCTWEMLHYLGFMHRSICPSQDGAGSSSQRLAAGRMLCLAGVPGLHVTCKQCMEVIAGTAVDAAADILTQHGRLPAHGRLAT